MTREEEDDLGFKDVAVAFDGDRTITLTCECGQINNSWAIVLTSLKYHGVFADGKSYAHGDVVTWAGHLWYCEKAGKWRRS